MNRALILSLMLVGVASAQQATQRLPDCQVKFRISVTGSTDGYDNRGQGCDTWNLEYSAYNASAVSIRLQSAPDNNNTPGTWVNFGAALTSTAYDANSTDNYVPWLRVTGTFTFSAGGFVEGVVVGWRPGPSETGGGGNCPALPFTSVQWNNAGVCGGNAAFEWDNTNLQLNVDSAGTLPLTHIGGAVISPMLIGQDNALYYNADPTFTVDSSAALNTLINTLAPGGVNQNGSVYIPPGNYQCGSVPLSWGSTVTGLIIVAHGVTLNGCDVPTADALRFIEDHRNSDVTIYGALSLPNVHTFSMQNFSPCDVANECGSITTNTYLGPRSVSANDFNFNPAPRPAIGATNTAGNALNLISGLSTGSGAAGQIRIGQYLAGSSGSTDNTLTNTWLWLANGDHIPNADATYNFGNSTHRPLAVEAMTLKADTTITNAGIAFASLGTPANGNQVFCTDCQVTSSADGTCTNSGSGSLAVRVNSTWQCAGSVLASTAVTAAATLGSGALVIGNGARGVSAATANTSITAGALTLGSIGAVQGSLILAGATSGSATLGVGASGSKLQLGSAGITASAAGTMSALAYASGGNCSSSASPAVCSASPAGSVVVAAAATTVVVNTTAVTANSQIFLMYDSSLGTKLSVTCNTTEPALYGVTARTAATSFTITSSAPVTNPACFSYFIVN